MATIQEGWTECTGRKTWEMKKEMKKRVKKVLSQRLCICKTVYVTGLQAGCHVFLILPMMFQDVPKPKSGKLQGKESQRKGRALWNRAETLGSGLVGRCNSLGSAEDSRDDAQVISSVAWL